MTIIIKMNLNVHGTSPHQIVCDAVEHLAKLVVNASEQNPALGGALYNLNDKQIGSYIVKFK